MSNSIVLWAGAVGLLGVEAVLVMALALGLCSAAAVTLCQLAPCPDPRRSGRQRGGPTGSAPVGDDVRVVALASLAATARGADGR